MKFRDEFTNAGTNDLGTYNNWVDEFGTSAINIVDTALFNNSSGLSVYCHDTTIMRRPYYVEADFIINTVDGSELSVIAADGYGFGLINGWIGFAMSSTALTIYRNTFVKATVAFSTAINTYRIRGEVISTDTGLTINLYIDGILKLSYVSPNVYPANCGGIGFKGDFYDNSIDNFEIHELVIQQFCDDGTGL